MKTKLLRMLAALWLLGAACGAHAVITCSVSSSGFSTAYDPALATTTTAQTSVTVSCSRASGDPTQVSFSIQADNGMYPSGVNNKSWLPGNSYLKYDVYTNSTCGTQWKGNRTLDGIVDFSKSSSTTLNYWGCVTAGQTGLPAGTYTDTVTMTLSYGPNPQSTTVGMFGVSISSPWTCSISSPPGTVAFTYVSYQGGAASASTGFGVTCTNSLPYTLSVSPATGTIAGLAYSLALSASGGTGSGSQQSLTINGSMAGGQPGTCALGSCSGTNSHTLTLTY